MYVSRTEHGKKETYASYSDVGDVDKNSSIFCFKKIDMYGYCSDSKVIWTMNHCQALKWAPFIQITSKKKQF